MEETKENGLIDDEEELLTDETSVVEEDLEHISAAEVNEIMAKYDRESATRIFSGKKAVVMKALLIAFTVFAVSINTFIRLNAQVHRALFIALILFLAFLLPYFSVSGFSITVFSCY